MNAPRPAGETKYVFLTYDQPQVLAGFFMEALRMDAWFRCRLTAMDEGRPGRHPWATEFWPIAFGKVMELEITVEGNPSRALLGLINSLLGRQVRNARFSGN